MHKALPTWDVLFPAGRVIYYEGNDPDGFAEQVKREFGFDPRQAPPGDPGLWRRAGGFFCPPEHLNALYGSDRWPLGS